MHLYTLYNFYIPAHISIFIATRQPVHATCRFFALFYSSKANYSSLSYATS